MPSDEPNKKMDDMLKAYAKTRREQAEPALEMHPATRKLLQEEVKRTRHVAPKQTRPSWLSNLWGFGALGGAFAVLLVLFVVFRAPMHNTLPAVAPAERNFSESKAVSPVAAKKDASELVAAPPKSASLARSSAPTGAAGASPADSVTRGSQREMRYGGRADAPNESAVTFDKIAGASPAPNDGSNAAAFVQVQISAGLAESPPANILSNFRVSRAGQNVRVVDADGSIYDGEVLGGFGGGGSAGDFAKNKQFKAASQDANANANYAFTVAGTNRLAQQKIVFTGNISNVLDMQVSDAAGQIAAQNQKASKIQTVTSNGVAQSAQNQNSRLTGKVQVGGGKEFKIEAKTPPP